MSPYFDGCYFDPTYFDAAPCSTGGSRRGNSPETRARMRVAIFAAQDADEAWLLELIDDHTFSRQGGQP